MMYAIDVETYQENDEGLLEPVLNARKFSLGCIVDEKLNSKFFTNPDEMADYILNLQKYCERINKHAYLYAHNTSYDWYAIFKNNLILDNVKYINLNRFLAFVGAKMCVSDSMSFFKMSLEEVGKMINYHKLKMPERVFTVSELKPYLLRDTEIVMKSMLYIKDKLSTLGFRPRKFLTAGQVAMSTLMTYCKKNSLVEGFMEYVKVHMPEYTRSLVRIIPSKYPYLVRESFRGGNNQAFRTGKFSDVTLVDINGLYTHAMSEMEFPDLRTELYCKYEDINLLKRDLNDSIGIANVKLQSPNMDLPYLPIRYDKMQYYPRNCTMIGTWTFLELKRALEFGYKILSLNWIIKYKKNKINPLKSYVNHIYEIERTSSNDLEKYPFKLLRNSLYGKFAQVRKNKDYLVIPRHELSNYSIKGYTVESVLEDKYLISIENEDYVPNYVNPIISSQITAYARDYLYTYLSSVNYDDLLYTDTDSVMFKGDYIDNFPISDKLGHFKLIEKGNCKILGEKRYYINDMTKIAGIPKNQSSKKILEDEAEIIIKKIISLKEGLKKSELKDVGSFKDERVEIKPHSKLMTYLPSYIDETDTWKLAKFTDGY